MDDYKPFDSSSTTKRMIGVVILVLIAALLLAFLLKGKNRHLTVDNSQWLCFNGLEAVAISDKKPSNLKDGFIVIYDDFKPKTIEADGCVELIK